MKIFKKLNIRVLIVVFLTLMISIAFIGIYTQRHLLGNIDNHILSSKLFGIPEELENKGLKPFYMGAKETGWDGQFYYYIANDLLGIRDTPEHIDATSYRYQRVGLSILAKILSIISLQSWVSPLTYYLTSLILVLLATYLASTLFLIKYNRPWIAFFWSLGIGTQLTMLNGLPDAAADALLIMAIYFLINRKNVLYVLSVTFAILSREAYLLLPLSIGFCSIVSVVHYNRGSQFCFKSFFKGDILLNLIPVVVFVLWQTYIRIHFGVSPSSQAHGILNWPFLSTFNYIWLSFRGIHPLFTKIHSYREFFLISAFLVILGISFKVSIKSILSKFESNTRRSVGLMTLLLSLLYICFGNTVMMHYTGYLKAANIFFFLIPVLYSNFTLKSIKFLNFVFILFSVFNLCILFSDRVSTPPYIGKYNSVQPIRATNTACFDDFSTEIKLLNLNQVEDHGIFANTIFSNGIYEAEVIIKNKSPHTFYSTNGTGSVHMSYHWLNNEGTSIKDGFRTLLREDILPGKSSKVKMLIFYPRLSGNYLLRLSLVQEGCAWFYLKNPNSKLDYSVNISYWK